MKKNMIMDNPKFKPQFRMRATSALVAALFLQTSIYPSTLYAAPKILANSPAKTFLENISPDVASVVKVKEFLKPSETLQVVQIQDAHSNPSAQKNIAEILKQLYQNYPDMMVAVEGAQGKLRPDFFNLFSDYPGANQAIVNDLVSKGDVTGAELFAWELYKNRPKKNDASASLLFLGVEEPTLYRDNYEAYRKFLERRGVIDVKLGDVRSWLSTQESRYLNPDLQKFLKERDRRREGKFDSDGPTVQGNSDLSAYVDYLSREVLPDLQIDLSDPVEQLRFPQLIRFLKLKTAEREWDGASAQKEWPLLLKEMRTLAKTDWDKTLVQALDLYARKKGLLQKETAAPQPSEDSEYARALFEKLYRFFETNHLSLIQYYQVVLSFEQAIFSSEIQAAKLIQEIDVLEEAYLSGYKSTEEGSKWLKRHIAFSLLEKIMRLGLTDTEFSEALDQGLVMNQILEEGLGKKIESSIEMKNWLKEAFHFYQVAKKRDQIMTDRALQAASSTASLAHRRAATQKTPQPVLLVMITGGFHSEGILSILESKQINYVSLRPRMNADQVSRQLYDEVMAGKHSSLKAYFKNQNLFKLPSQAVLFKSALEIGVPYLISESKVAPAKIPSILQTLLEEHPLFNRDFETRLAMVQGREELTIHPKMKAPRISTAQFTVSAPLLASEYPLTDLTANTTAENFTVTVNGADRIVVQESRQSSPTVSLEKSGARIVTGELTKALLLSKSRGLTQATVNTSTPGIPITVVFREPVAYSVSLVTTSVWRRSVVARPEARAPAARNFPAAQAWFSGILSPGASASSVIGMTAASSPQTESAAQMMLKTLDPEGKIFAQGAPIHLILSVDGKISVQGFEALFVLGALNSKSHVSLVTSLNQAEAVDLQGKFRAELRKLGLAETLVSVIGAGKNMASAVNRLSVSGEYARHLKGILGLPDLFSGLHWIKSTAWLDKSGIQNLVVAALMSASLLEKKPNEAFQIATPYAVLTWMNQIGVSESTMEARVQTMLQAIEHISTAA